MEEGGDEPLSYSESGVESRDRSRPIRSRRMPLCCLRCPSSDGARGVVEEVGDLCNLGSDVTFSIRDDESLR